MGSYGLAFLGGCLIGLAALGLLFFNGRILGISGIVGGLGDRAPWRFGLLLGLLSGGLLLRWLAPAVFLTTLSRSPGVLLIAGLLVGYGTQLGNGCTSGHGICGIGRLSPRSLLATLVFMGTGALTVFLIQKWAGGVL